MSTRQVIRYSMMFLFLLFPTFLVAQQNIRQVVLKDGVERWYRVKANDPKPLFFQQVEELFKVILPAKDLPFGVSVAFLVGVSQYDYLAPDLPFVKNDLRDMSEFLLAEGGFDTVYVASEKIVNRDLIEDYMRNKLGRWLNKRDRLFYYYSGHGADSGGKTGYMQFAQAQPGNFAARRFLPLMSPMIGAASLILRICYLFLTAALPDSLSLQREIVMKSTVK